MKVTMIVGMPGVGKSTIMKQFIGRLGDWVFKNPKWLPHHARASDNGVVLVLGRYDDANHPYPGTDRMSMAVQQHAIQFILRAKDLGCSAVLFEGDRLGNDSMIKALQYIATDFEVVRIRSSRNIARPDQTDKFRQSRATKLANMFGPLGRLARTKQHHREFFNDKPNDVAYIVDWLIGNRL